MLIWNAIHNASDSSGVSQPFCAAAEFESHETLSGSFYDEFLHQTEVEKTLEKAFFAAKYRSCLNTALIRQKINDNWK